MVNKELVLLKYKYDGLRIFSIIIICCLLILSITVAYIADEVKTEELDSYIIELDKVCNTHGYENFDNIENGIIVCKNKIQHEDVMKISLINNTEVKIK